MYRSGHKKHQLSDAAKDFKKKGTKGSLTRAAHRHGYKSALKFAKHVEASPKGSKLRSEYGRKSNWAINMNK